MGSTIVSSVIETLRNADLRTDEAYPGVRIPDLQSPAVAVRLGKIDRAVRMTTVLVTVLSPAGGGGSICETTALRAVEALQAMGGTCQKDVCKFDDMADVFYIEIQVEFFGTAKEDDWSAGPGYLIHINNQRMDDVVRFVASRAVDDEAAAIKDAKWSFTLEELLPPGTSEPTDPVEPFTLLITRSNGDEMFTQCTWTSVKREDTIRGVSQIREGLAGARTVMGIL